MKAERESLEPARWSTLAGTSDDSVMEVLSLILLIYYHYIVSGGCCFGVHLMSARFMYHRDLLNTSEAPLMSTAKSRIRHKYFHLDSAKILRAQKILRADTETETIERALDLVISEHGRNQLARKANGGFLKSGIEVRDVCGGLGTEIASRFKKVGLVTDIPELRGHKIRPVSFGRRK